ncbi:MAG: phosphoribose diphosphate:decaprenyl-phosphate phosphoribosyltransferase [uncultured bacterium]|nr:MAG: phosphoribose diphosphate:decaprenyl-phosphate phosphoribosyltransferase [uncultured bacterium]
MKNNKLRTYFYALRINQWLKNFVIFTAIIFSGQLFNVDLLIKSFHAFFIFCLLSSTSYVLNDIIDYPFDKKHPVKKFRPIASGDLSMPEATFIVFTLSLASLILALFFSLPFFFLSLFFILLHFFYSFTLKRQPVVDIFTISFSFMIRTFAGEIATGYHIPIWLLLTIFFGSLFMASVKRHAELVAHGVKARMSLYRYNEHFLDFLTYTFGTATIIAYSTYAYVERPPQTATVFSEFFNQTFPGFEARKWLMITIPVVVYGVARYAQLLYEKAEGERPERTITTDIPLIVTIALWGIIVISLIYLL